MSADATPPRPEPDYSYTCDYATRLSNVFDVTESSRHPRRTSTASNGGRALENQPRPPRTALQAELVRWRERAIPLTVISAGGRRLPRGDRPFQLKRMR